MLADADLAADFAPAIGCDARAIRMHMGFESPCNAKDLFLDIGDELIDGSRAGASGPGIEIEHWIDDGSVVAAGILHDVGDGVARLAEECLDLRLHEHLLLNHKITQAHWPFIDASQSRLDGADERTGLRD